MLRDLCRRKASVDENYEWDAVDFCPRPAVDDGKSCFFSCFFLFLFTCSSQFGTNIAEKKILDTFVC